jgi:hypothetical protein
MNLQQLRDFCRAQLDVDDEELPNSLLDSYLDEGFQRTMAMEDRWPFYEQFWVVTKVDGDESIAIPIDCNGQQVQALIDSVSGARLMQISNELAEDNFFGETGVSETPCYYSIFGSALWLWPKMIAGAADRVYALRGYRLPRTWVTEGAGAVPDCDARLHALLAHYAIALFYAQEEDEVLEDVYMKRWQASYQAAHAAICSPRHHRPLILNGGLPYSPASNPVVWSNPPVAP